MLIKQVRVNTRHNKALFTKTHHMACKSIKVVRNITSFSKCKWHHTFKPLLKKKIHKNICKSCDKIHSCSTSKNWGVCFTSFACTTIFLLPTKPQPPKKTMIFPLRKISTNLSSGNLMHLFKIDYSNFATSKTNQTL